MDRSWIVHGRQFTPPYNEGIREFLRFVGKRYGENVQMPCPCRHCLNEKMIHHGRLEIHLLMNGMSNTYTRWIHHGESMHVDVIEDVQGNDENADNDHENAGHEHENAGHEHDNMDGIGEAGGDTIPEMLQELLRAEEEARTDQATRAENQGDGNDVGMDGLFAKLLAEAKRQLYPGGNHVSRFSFVVKLLHHKSYHRISNTTFDGFLKMMVDALPPHNTLPRSYNEAKAYLCELGLSYEPIHVCPNNCILFRKKYAEANNCDKCGASRWKYPNKKKVHVKVLRYFPLLARMRRMFACKRTAEDTQWHRLKRKVRKKIWSHPADGEAWKEFDKEWKEFAQDPRNLRLGLATDGFNPFGNMSTSYNMWPVFVVPYNLPPWAYMDQSNCMLALLIPGPDCPGKDFNVFLEPLIDDLKVLWKGLRTYDAFKYEMFDLRAAVLWCIHDYPALSTMSGPTTRGYAACTHCDKDPLSCSIKYKMCYISHHRFLRKGHHLRKETDIVKVHKSKEKLGTFSKEELLAEVEKVKDVRPGINSTSKKRKRGEPTPIWNQRVGLWDLPYWPSLKLRNNLDVMDIEKNICDNLLGTLLDIEGKNKDTINARIDLFNMGIRKELQLKESGNKYDMPPARYTLKKKERIAFCQFLSELKFPNGFCSNISRCVNVATGKVTGRKTHDCHILLQRVLPTGMRGFVDNDIYVAIAELGQFFRELCSRTLDLDVLHCLKDEILVILCKLEKIFPPAFFDVMVHLAVHLPDEAILRGPVNSGWMYPIEKMLGKWKSFVRNKARLEGSVAEAYIAEECLTFCSRYLHDVETRFNRPPRNVGDEHESSCDVFGNGVNLLGGCELIPHDKNLSLKKELDKIAWYVLNNCKEVKKYKELFKEELEKDEMSNVDKRLVQGFAGWFKAHMMEKKREKPKDDDENFFALACGPSLGVRSYSACVVNGVRFLTIDREKGKQAQNSRVMTAGDHNGKPKDFYGVLKEIKVLYYNSNEQFMRSVVLFKCDWYRLADLKTPLEVDNGLFKSINITGLWYKDDNFILSTQATKVFYMPDIKLGKNWQIVQKFEHRHKFDVHEVEPTNISTYQEDQCSDNEDEEGRRRHVVTDDMPSVPLNRNDQECHTAEASVVEKLMRTQRNDEVEENDSEDDEDDTIQEYLSENEEVEQDDSDVD